MKKAFLLLFAGTVVFSACLKNSSTPACTDQDPSKEIASMQAFAITQGMTPSQDTLGLVYQIEAPGTSPLVSNAYDTVIIKYEGKLLNGTTFDKSDSVGPILVGSFVPGFRASLAKIGNGGHIKTIIPSYLAYGCNGNGSVIPANSPLYFDITIKKLGKKN